MAGNSTESGRSVTSKITSILLTFTEGSEHSLTEIARLAGLPISTAHRLTSELASWRLLERTDDGHYRAGLPLRMIGTVGSCPPSIAERAPCVLEDLSAATKSRARLGVLHELDVAYIEKHPGPRPATAFTPAATLPAHPTALGRALLAFSPTRTVEMTIMRGLRCYTPHTITSPDRFRRALAVTRLTRVAVTRWELELGVAVPVRLFAVARQEIAKSRLQVSTHVLHEVRDAVGVGIDGPVQILVRDLRERSVAEHLVVSETVRDVLEIRRAEAVGAHRSLSFAISEAASQWYRAAGSTCLRRSGRSSRPGTASRPGSPSRTRSRRRDSRRAR